MTLCECGHEASEHSDEEGCRDVRGWSGCPCNMQPLEVELFALRTEHAKALARETGLRRDLEEIQASGEAVGARIRRNSDGTWFVETVHDEKVQAAVVLLRTEVEWAAENVWPPDRRGRLRTALAETEGLMK